MHYHKFRICSNLVTVGIFIFCLTQLSGCSFVGNRKSVVDGAPSVDIDVSKIKDAVPRSEPYHPYGTKDYVVGGRRYHVLKSSKGYVKTGNASWYGSKFHGNHTSTQERYNLYNMTAASTELPLPSYVQVTNLRNGKKIIVRVNDRGPFHSNRILDLSYAGAKKLGFVNSGTAPVKVVAIDPKNWNKNTINRKPEETKDIRLASKSSNSSHKSSENIENKTLYLQVGAFSKLENAKKLSTKIAELIDKTTSIKQSDSLYRVHVGPLKCAAQGYKMKEILEKNGFNRVIVVTN